MEVIESSRKKNTLIFRLHQRAITTSRRIWKVVEKIIMKKLKGAISERARSSLRETSSSSFGRRNVLQSLTIVERITSKGNIFEEKKTLLRGTKLSFGKKIAWKWWRREQDNSFTQKKRKKNVFWWSRWVLLPFTCFNKRRNI
jgi:hypothetical protein